MTMIVSGSTGLEFPDSSDQTTAFTGNADTITSGILAVARGGTGVSSPGTAGNFLQSNGTAWVSAANPPPFVSGTLMLFQQTSAPTGWTKQTTHDNKALRVVSGSAGTGGSVAFTTAFASQTPAGSVSVGVSAGTLSVSAGSLAVSAGTLSAGATTLATSQMPSHTHNLRNENQGTVNSTQNSNRGNGNLINTIITQAEGGGGSHSHSLSGSPALSGSPSLSGSPTITSASFTGTAINLAVSYVDLIIASKD